jgi:hypothetical protein
VRGDPEDVDSAPRVLDDEERVEPVQGDGVEVEQVAGESPVGLGSEELGPRGSGSAGRRVDASVVQDLPDGGGADLVAEAGEFAVDASVAQEEFAVASRTARARRPAGMAGLPERAG